MPCARGGVLHVVVHTGSGVAAAIGDYMASVASFDQHLLVSRDTTCQIGDHLERMATSVAEMPPGPVAQIRCLRAAVEELRPDIIHAHSTFAGAWARLTLAPRWQPRIVYTPHCYAFERTDVVRPLRGAFWLAEAALSFRGAQVAACSPREATLARSLPGRQRVTYVPNVACVPADRSGTEGAPPGAIRVVAAGRVTAQKAPWVFAEAARRSCDRPSSGSGPGAMEWVWIGGGEERQEAVLRDAGVEVTGWLPREDALRRLGESHLYVHTASWEGAPMTVLEAAAAGVPVFARRTAAMEALGVAPLFDSVAELVDLVGDFPGGPAVAVATRCGELLRQNHSGTAQARALEAVYAATPALDAPPARPG